MRSRPILHHILEQAAIVQFLRPGAVEADLQGATKLRRVST
jgi:hypothetical protein